jgi:benzoylformate decarboxylase
LELPGIDFVELARGQGCEGVRVTRAEELHSTLRAALSSAGPVLVEVRVS